MRWLAGVVVLVIVAGGGGWWWFRSASEAPAPGLLSIVTTPAGARLTIGGREVGHTPYFADNTGPAGPVEYLLELEGYRSVRGTFDGGQAAQLAVTLVRKTLKRVIQVDAGVVEIELDEPEDDTPLHTRGPLRPAQPEEFVDEDLAKEAASPK